MGRRFFPDSDSLASRSIDKIAVEEWRNINMPADCALFVPSDCLGDGSKEGTVDPQFTEVDHDGSQFEKVTSFDFSSDRLTFETNGWKDH